MRMLCSYDVVKYRRLFNLEVYSSIIGILGSSNALDWIVIPVKSDS